VSWWTRVLLAAGASLVGATILGLLHAVTASGRLRMDSLGLPAVIPVVLFGSSIAAVCVFPFALWATRAGARNLWVYGSGLYTVLVVYVVIVMPRVGGPVAYDAMLLLAVVGLVLLGIIPLKRAPSSRPRGGG
jgi:hypothetical protein